MFLIDTNVISEIRKVKAGKANKQVAQWVKGIDFSLCYLSVITIHELEVGVFQAELKDKQKGKILRGWLNTQVLPAFEKRIIEISLPIIRQSAALNSSKLRPFRDCLIASTGLVYGMSVVTRNSLDFESIGVDLINPWDEIV
ncbi:MAG: type II toxin-antitoxin system VapC family toxin [Betaproteobacteria bacterium]